MLARAATTSGGAARVGGILRRAHAHPVIAGLLLAVLVPVLMPLVGGAPALALTCEAALASDGPTAATQLQELLDRAARSDDPASDCATWTLRLEGTFLLTNQLEYRGAPILHLAGTNRSDPAVLTAQGPDGHRVLALFAPARSVELTDLVLRGGRARGATLDGAGGAVVIEAQLDVVSELRATRVALRDNDATRGGAVAADRVMLVDVEVEGNTADEGAGLDVFELSAIRTTFVANEALGAPGTGGAVRASGDVTLVNSTFSANRAQVGGSVWMTGAAAPTLRATFTTFASVAADRDGAHLHADASDGGSVGIALRGSVLAGVVPLDPPSTTEATACSGFLAASDGDGSIDSLGVDTSCGDGVAVLTGPPLLAPLPSAAAGGAGAVRTGIDARVHRPTADSPLVDRVDCDASWPTEDQRGLARPAPGGGRCDVGAVELTVSPADDGRTVAPTTEEPIARGWPAAPTQVRAGGGIAQVRPRTSIRR
jgi:hypothetical protein